MLLFIIQSRGSEPVSRDWPQVTAELTIIALLLHPTPSAQASYCQHDLVVEHMLQCPRGMTATSSYLIAQIVVSWETAVGGTSMLHAATYTEMPMLNLPSKPAQTMTAVMAAAAAKCGVHRPSSLLQVLHKEETSLSVRDECVYPFGELRTLQKWEYSRCCPK